MLVAACGAAVPALPSGGGPAWTELESKHFTLWTDAPIARGRALIRDMEHLQQIIFGVAFPGLSSDGRSFVIALRDQFEVNAYVPESFQAFAWPGDNPLLLPVIVFSADTDNSDGHVLTHELSHVISHVAIHDQPVWFAEGLAEFFETVTLDADKAVVDVGEPLHNQVQLVRQISLVPGDQLLACKSLACRDHAFYATAGLLFSYLANVHPDRLLAYEDELVKRNPRAWDVIGIPPSDIDRVIREWTIGGRHQVWHYNAKLGKTDIAERALAEPDVIAVRAVLSYAFHAHTTAVQQALVADPTNLLLRLAELHRTRSISIADARATVKAHVDDWRAWLLVVLALKDHSEEATSAHARTCTLAKLNPAAMLPANFCALDRVPGAPEHGDQPVVPQQVP